MTRFQLVEFYVCAQELANATNEPKWDEAEAKPISVAQWNEAIALAMILDREVQGLPPPTPGADPDGFVWLTWEASGRRLALGMLASLVGNKYKWVARNDGTDAEHTANTLRPVIESIRATFGDTEFARRALWSNAHALV